MLAIEVRYQPDVQDRGGAWRNSTLSLPGTRTNASQEYRAMSLELTAP